MQNEKPVSKTHIRIGGKRVDLSDTGKPRGCEETVKFMGRAGDVVDLAPSAESSKTRISASHPNRTNEDDDPAPDDE